MASNQNRNHRFNNESRNYQGSMPYRNHRSAQSGYSHGHNKGRNQKPNIPVNYKKSMIENPWKYLEDPQNSKWIPLTSEIAQPDPTIPVSSSTLENYNPLNDST